MRYLVVVSALAIAGCQLEEPTLSETSQEVIGVVATVSFPSTQVGQSSTPITITVNPAPGNNTNQVTAVTYSCPDFSVNAPGLPATVYRICEYEPCPLCAVAPPCITVEQETYQFTATFSPQVAAPLSCVLTVVANTGNRTVTLNGTGTVPPLSADAIPASVGFGDVRRNTASSVATITLRNTGGQSLTVSSVSTTGPFAITSGPTAGFSLPPGQTQAYGVTCNPTAVGAASGTFAVASNYPVSVPLSCNGIDSNLDITPSPSTIPTTRVGEPRVASISLINSGGAAMQLESVSLTGTDMSLSAAPPANMMLGPGASASAMVTFGAAASGDASGTLTVMYDGGQTRTAQISARALGTSISMTPNGAVDLGPVCAGQSVTQPFSILANDQGPFQVSAISTPEAPFSIAAPALPASVMGGGANTVTFDVTAAPTDAGIRTATVTVDTDIPNGTPQMIELSVEGLAAGVTGTPLEVDLGSSTVGAVSVAQAVNVTNCTDATVTLSNARIEGPDAAEFSIVLHPDDLGVAAGDTREWLVISAPGSPGAKQASFLVDGPDGPVTISLLGEGLGENVGGGEGDDSIPSYYACSTAGGGGAAWPLLLALAFLRRKRR